MIVVGIIVAAVLVLYVALDWPGLKFYWDEWRWPKTIMSQRSGQSVPVPTGRELRAVKRFYGQATDKDTIALGRWESASLLHNELYQAGNVVVLFLGRSEIHVQIESVIPRPGADSSLSVKDSQYVGRVVSVRSKLPDVTRMVGQRVQCYHFQVMGEIDGTKES